MMKMSKGRMEAFSDGVLAVAITIMVLELKIPHGDTVEVLFGLLPKFLSYILSFIYLGIYWNNHHHLLQTVRHVNGGVLWANNHLLFWLTLIPFSTDWLGEHPLSATPLVAYGFVLLMSAVAYFLLQNTLMAAEGSDSVLKAALSSDLKGKLSPLGYLLAMIAANWIPWISISLYVLIASIWLIPDQRIEKQFTLDS